MNKINVQTVYNIHQQNLNFCKEFDFNFVKNKITDLNFWKNKDAARLPATFYFSQYVKQFNLTSKKLLSFGGLYDPECKMFPKDKWVDCDYWINDKHDIENLHDSNLDKDFDFCFANQIFEHLMEIEESIKNIKKHLITGGYFYSNFPVINIPHGEPFYFFTGITVQYIIYLLIKNNFKILVSGQWGNEDYIKHIYTYLSWPDYTQIKLNNDINRPCIGWVLAQKQ